MPRLLINPGTPSAWEIQLRPGTNSLGRGFSTDFKIDHHSVSSTNCQIVVDDSGKAVLQDLGSTNGTFLNGTPITEAELHPGQTLHLGGVELLVQADISPNARVAETEIIPLSAMPAPIRPTFATASVMSPPSVPIGTQPVAEPADVLELPPPPRADPIIPPTLSQAPPVVPASTPPARTAGSIGLGYASEKCKYHPKTPARFRCNKCNHAYCELCVATRSEGGVHRKFCRTCAGECVAVKVVIQQAATAPNFYKSLPGAFVYPLKGMGIIFLVFMTLFFSAAPMAQGFRLYLQVIIGGYLFAYLQAIIHSTAMDDKGEPAFPDITNFAEDIVTPFFQLLGIAAFCFGQTILLAIVRLNTDFTSLGAAMLATATLGCIYFPMAFLAVAMLDTVTAVNPLLVVPSILKVIKPYLITIALFFLVALLEWLSNTALDYFFKGKVNTKDMGEFMLRIGSVIAGKFISIYLLTVNARILALLYVSKKQELGWFAR
jgi:pSer/pThr/pTyr-binding forkhead associated (FHA) protein